MNKYQIFYQNPSDPRISVDFVAESHLYLFQFTKDVMANGFMFSKNFWISPSAILAVKQLQFLSLIRLTAKARVS